ncbi:guanine deaminase [Aulographum hederae CBS 113979]|uniref:Guanine deaminase n=1 Tax=Aulographum hederae CBS 113979 TaxID=1176131 RepID=A0A6G1H2B4_9PEZI|nr:guanine deaminase [Aulographum hederae CBS 113979]
MAQIFFGRFVHSVSLKELEICEHGGIGVDERGKIVFVERNVKDVQVLLEKPGWENAKVVRIFANSFMFPGFIDTHIHASQYPNAGIFGSSTLLDWLNTYTFPLESKFQELDVARTVYNRVVSRTLANGTTTASYYATIHVPSTNLLADICLARGQRAFVGRVCMDQNAPDYYRDETVDEVISATRQCIDHIKKIDPEHQLVTPIITPRFAPSCTRQCLDRLGELHKETNLPVQTHISENKGEIQFVKELFPDSTSYADVYEKSGLLTEKMILAHAVHLTEDEKALIKKRDAKISHCPASNTALTSGTAKVRQLVDAGITVSLGTDVSGGFSASILESARQAIWVSRFVAMEGGDDNKLSVAEVLYLATRGGAKTVGLEDQIGGFEVGKDWDVQMINLGEVDEGSEGIKDYTSPVDIFGWESQDNVVAKWLYSGDDRNVVAVWVKGKLVHTTSRYSL